MPLTNPTVSITIEVNNGAIIVDFQSQDGNQLKVNTQLRENNINEWYSNLHNHLDTFRELFSGSSTNIGWPTVTRAMQYLYKNGTQLNFQLFGERRREVESFLRKCYFDWESAGSPGKIPQVIELKAPDKNLLLPLEFLPLFDTRGELPNITNADELRKAAARFLGFSTIINRIFYKQAKPSKAFTDSSFNNPNGLSIRFFCHEALPGASKEKIFFETTPGINFLGRWPSIPLSSKDFVQNLSAILWNGCDLTSSTTQVVDHIQHFSCHCDTDQKSSVDYSITLAVKKKNIWGSLDENKIKLGDMEYQFGIAKERDDTITYPLIFLNACGSSKMIPAAVNSFPGLFLEIKNRGVIGTETKIPDNFACEFSKLVYLKLLNSETLGNAIYLSRWHFLLSYKNPLGILYTIYANPDLKVSVPLMANKATLSNTMGSRQAES